MLGNDPLSQLGDRRPILGIPRRRLCQSASSFTNELLMGTHEDCHAVVWVEVENPCDQKHTTFGPSSQAGVFYLHDCYNLLAVAFCLA